jgi:YVTN family beta-propeller protein
MGALLSVAAGTATLAGAQWARAGAPATPTNQLVTGKSITPTGTQTPLGSVPLNGAMSPDGQYLVTTSNGFRQFLHVISTVDGGVRDSARFQDFSDSPPVPGIYVPTGSLYYGVAFSPDGKSLYASGGSDDVLYVYRMTNAGELIPNGVISNPRPASSPFANFTAGLALSGDGKQLFAANNFTDTLSVIDTGKRTVTAQIPVPGYPFALAATSDGNKVYVASQRDNVIAVVSPRQGKVINTIAVGDHPDALTFDGPQRRLFVANAQSDTVSIIDTGSDRVIETINLRPAQAMALPGATATGLALSPSGKTLYVTLADMNAVAVVSVSSPNSQVQGYIPTGWYPSCVSVSPDGQRLFVLNAKGVQTQNPNPQAGQPYNENSSQYVYYLFTGTLSMISVPGVEDLATMTQQVLTNNNLARLTPDPDEIQPNQYPIQHIIYIIKENRTYDQVLGDLSQGNGDPSLTLFGQDVTPNQHKIATTWALLDNFYDCGEVSGVGWNWSNASYPNEYTEKANPYQYSGRGGSSPAYTPTYDYEGQNRGLNTAVSKVRDVAEGANGYIWDQVAKKGLTYRNYGFFMSFGNAKAADNVPTKAGLTDHTDLNFRRFDMKVSDQDRFTEWKKEFDQFVTNKNLPNFLMVRFPRDHTEVTVPGYNTPRAMVADNDLAVGKLVEAVSHSPYWPNTAIFIIEDDAQDGPDHVDCHRSTCYVVSPYVTRGQVSHQFFNTESVLHTMELLMGLPPLSQYDAIAPSFKSLFTSKPDVTPYDAAPATVDLNEMNSQTAFGAAESKKMASAFEREDQAPADRVNRILWHSIKGKNVPYPKIRRGLKLASRGVKRDVD